MNILTPTINVDRFFDHVQTARQRALLLDYDGTLAPFRTERDKAIPYSGVRDILRDIISAGHTRLVLISGRWINDLLPLLALDQPPEIWGSHGWERRMPDGRYEPPALEPQIVEALSEAQQRANHLGVGEHFEQKPASVALHWRGLPQSAIDTMRKQAAEHWLPLAQKAGLHPHEFDGGIELRVPGRDKGFAVRALLQELGPGAAVAFLGDDRTDEDAFLALKGNGLPVLVRSEFRPTAAEVWLKPPAELIEFLERWHTVCKT